MLNEFNTEIERLAASKGSYIEAIVDFAGEKGIDVEDVADALHENIIKKLKAEYIAKNYFPNTKIENSLTGFMNE